MGRLHVRLDRHLGQSLHPLRLLPPSRPRHPPDGRSGLGLDTQLRPYNDNYDNDNLGLIDHVHHDLDVYKLYP